MNREQQSVLVLHRVRASLVRQRTAADNVARGLLRRVQPCCRQGQSEGGRATAAYGQVGARAAVRGLPGSRTCQGCRTPSTFLKLNQSRPKSLASGAMSYLGSYRNREGGIRAIRHNDLEFWVERVGACRSNWVLPNPTPRSEWTVDYDVSELSCPFPLADASRQRGGRNRLPALCRACLIRGGGPVTPAQYRGRGEDRLWRRREEHRSICMDRRRRPSWRACRP